VRIALVTDVHGNLPALEAVLADARAQGCAAVWDGGDVVGYLPWPGECVDRLRQIGAVGVMGNYDRKVLRTPQRRERWLARKDPLKARTLIWAWQHLDAAARQELALRPQTVRWELAGRRVLLCHASPLSLKEALTPATTPQRWRTLAAAADAQVVLHGHIHLPQAHRVPGTLFYTPGPVGRPQDGDPRAAYAVLEVTAGGLMLRRRRVAYDTGVVAAEIRRRRLPEVFAVMVSEGIGLERARRRLAAAPR
jgi:predicted phosphodiesterase